MKLSLTIPVIASGMVKSFAILDSFVFFAKKVYSANRQYHRPPAVIRTLLLNCDTNVETILLQLKNDSDS